MSAIKKSFIIYGTPKPKKRPRVYRWSTVNPSKNDEMEAAQQLSELSDCFPLSGQIKVTLRFFKNPPKATPKWKLPLMEEKIIRPNKSPDLDNYVKLILDAFNGILWEDDRFIVQVDSSKFYTINKERTEIEIEDLPFPMNKKQTETNYWEFMEY